MLVSFIFLQIKGKRKELKMEKVKNEYLVSHLYDTDGGFGDAICQEEPLFVVYATPEEMDEFVEKWDKPYVYDKPYANLMCHGIKVAKVIPIADISDIDENWLEDKLNFGHWGYDEEEEA